MRQWIETFDSRLKPSAEIENSIRMALDSKHYEWATSPNSTAIEWLYGELVKALDAKPKRGGKDNWPGGFDISGMPALNEANETARAGRRKR